MKNHPSWLSPCPPPCLFWVFLSSSYFLLLPFLRQGSSAVTYCFVHMVICYFNNNSKKKKKSRTKWVKLSPFSFTVGFESNQTREEPEAACSQVTFLHADTELRMFHHEEQRLRGRLRMSLSLEHWLSVPIPIATPEPEWRWIERCRDPGLGGLPCGTLRGLAQQGVMGHLFLKGISIQ